VSRRLACLELEQVQVMGVPAADAVQHEQRKHREQTEPRHVALAERNDDRRRQQRAERRTGVAADLEGRLRQTKAPARGQPGNSRGFG
jgi:hypothetical protein